MGGTDLGRKKQVACVSMQKVRGSGGTTPLPLQEIFLKMTCLEVASEVMFESKKPSVLPELLESRIPDWLNFL